MRLATEVTETGRLFEILANNSPVGLYIVQDGRFCYTNPTFQSTTGYKEDELLGRDALKLVVSEDREQVRENAIKMLKGELTSPYQFRVTHKNGSIKWVMESVVSVQYHGRRATLGYFVDITERKRMEEALQDSEEKLRKMFESVTDGISVIDLKGSITEVNQRTVEMHGYSSKDELQGKNALELLASRDHKRITANTKKVIKQGAIRGVEYTLLRADGSEFPGELSTNALKDTSGNLFGHITIVRDITERKQVEEKMQHLYLVLLAIRNINKLIAMGTDRDGLLKGACDTFVKTSGYYGAWIALLDESGKLVTAAEAGLGESFLQVMERLKRGELTHCGCKVLEKPGVLVMKDVSSECEDCPVAKEDTGRGAISAKLEYSGKVYGLMTVYIPPGRVAEKEEHNMLEEIAGDIGFALHSMEQEQERKRVEEALRDSEEKLWKIFESATDGISVIDLKGIITEVNQRTVEMHGYSSKDELRGKNALELLAPRDHKRIAANMKKVIKQGAIRGVEYTLLRADGSEFPGELSTNALKDASGNLFGHITIARDITERKQAEEEIRKSQASFAEAQHIAHIGSWNWQIKPNSLYWSDEMYRIFGIERPQFGATHEAFVNCVHPDDREFVKESINKALYENKPHDIEYRIVLPNGRERIIHAQGRVIFDNTGEPTRVIGTAHDITERKQAEDKVQHLNLVLRAIRNINQLIARGTDRDSLLKGACDTFVKTSGYYSAWIALLDESGKLVTAAEAGLGKSFLQVMEGLKRGELTHCGYKVLEKPGVLVIKDVSSECEDCPMAKEDTGRDAMSVRLEYGGKVYGLMTVSIPPGRAAEKEEHDMLEEIAGDIGFALHSMEQAQERKRAKEALRASEEMYKTVVEDAPIGIYYNDFNGTFLYGNKKAEEIVGHKMEELLGKSFLKLKLLRPEGIAKAAKLLALNKRGKATGPDLFTLNRKDGTTSIVEIRTKVSTFGGKKAVLGMVEDFTERKKAEKELSKTQAQLSSAVQIAHLGPWEYDAINDLFIFNDAFYEMFHTTAKEVGGYTMSSAEYARRFVHPEDAPLVGEEVRKAIQADDPNFSRQLDHRIIYADGKVGYISVRFFIIKDETGKTVRTYGVNQDITERKQAEEALQAEKNKLQSLIDAMEDTITIQDTEYNFIYQNEPSRIASGGDHLGEKCYRVYEGRESICEDCPVEKAFKDGKSHISERMTTIAGKVAFWENTANPIRDAEGKIVSCIELARDITERKRQEQALADELTQRRLLIDKSLDGIVVLDVNAKVVEANQRFAEMLGYTLEEVYNLHTWDWDKTFPPEKLLEMGRNVDEKGLHLETKHTRKDGSVFDVDISISAIMCGGQKLIFCIDRDITERKQAEEVIQAERNKLQSLIDAMEDNLTIQDRDYNLIYLSERVKKLWGDCIGEKCYRVFEGQEKVCDECPVEKAFKDGRSHIAERRTVIPSGEVIFWENTANPIKDADGRIVSCLEVSKDITERKRIEEALRDSEEKLRKMFESVTDGISVIDLKGLITEPNQRMMEMHGFRSEDELRGKSAFELVAPRDHEKIAAHMKKAIKQEAIRGVEYTLLRADGSEFPGELSTSALKDASDNVVGHITIVRDITERKRAEEAIKQAAEEWRNTFDSISDAISIHDRDFRILRANKASADIFHMRPDQIIGKYCYELHKGGKPISGCPHKQTLATGKPAAAEFYESHLGKYLLESTSPIFDEKGEVVSTIHITRDITEQKQQNERLMMADRLASIGELAAGTAHELNNPLTSVLGFTQLIMEKDIPDDIREDLKLIHSEAQRAAGVTKNLLTFARRQAPVKQLNQINNIIEDVLKLRAYEHKVNSIEVQRQLAPNLPEIKVDYFQMQQVFLNTIINAEYFMIEAHNRGTLIITTKKRNGNIRISIADDGPGIPPENLSRIFNPFFTTKAAGKGTGLGLSICHGIVAEHGGQIYAKSHPGKGTTIIIELPVNGH